MLIWINGTFGVGKTTTATALAEQTGWPSFDPEHVGFLLMSNLRDVAFDDFQDLAPWRELVPVVAASLMAFRGTDTMIAVQTVLVEAYWNELRAAFGARGIDVHHVVLDADEAALRHRIDHDTVEAQARDWRLDHLEPFRLARPWMVEQADLVVDTTTIPASAAASEIATAVGS